jgi:integrase/recombinase XerD
MEQRIEEFLAYLLSERRLSPNTVSAYRNDLTQFADHFDAEAARRGGNVYAVSTIDRERLGAYFLSLRDRGYSSASIARKMAAIRSFFQYLRRNGEVATDPTDGLGSPEVKKPLPKTASDGDLQTLLAYCQSRETPEGTRDHAMLRLLCATGMRVGELVMLDVSDVDLGAGHVRVVGRGSRERTLPLDASTVASLRTYVEQARPYLARTSPGQSALVLNQRGQRLTRQGFWLIMKSIVRGAGLPVEITPHTLRHSFATHHIGEGLDLEELRRLLGHASIATTQVYAQIVQQTPEQAVPSPA